MEKAVNPILKSKLFIWFVVSTLCLPVHAQLNSVFKDVTKSSGINHQFKVYEGMFGGGACVFDFNNDGFEDLYITGGMNDDQLYKNNKNGTFTNVFVGSGLEVTKNM